MDQERSLATIMERVDRVVSFRRFRSKTGRGDCEMAHADVDIPNLLALKALRAQNPRFDIALSWGMEWLNLFFRYRLVTEII